MGSTAKKIGIGCAVLIGGLFALIVMALMGLGFAMHTGHIPESAAMPKGKIHQRQLEELKSMKEVEADETVLFFYSDGFLSIREAGNLFTDKRVITYSEYDDELFMESATYSEIESIEFTKSDSWLENSMIIVTKKDGDDMYLGIATEAKRDTLYF